MSAARYRRVDRVRRFVQQSSPIPKILVGLLLELFFVLGSIIHIETSEAFFLGEHVVGLVANWAVLSQPWQLATGALEPALQEAVIWGWGIECVFLICIVGHDKLHKNVRRNARWMGKVFLWGTIILVFFDGYTDFNYGNIASGFWGQLGFALITSFVVFFFGTGGWHLLSEGLSELTEQWREEEIDDED